MAGAGSRFAEAGYTTPKPFIHVEGVPMARHVMEDCYAAFGALETTLLVREEHVEAARARLDPNHIVPVYGLTQGAACTTLLAESGLDPTRPLIIANSDQRFSVSERVDVTEFDGTILVHHALTGPKWSYAASDEHGFVQAVIEKPAVVLRGWEPTIGVYAWAKASYYFDSVRRMMDADDRTNGEFYCAPSFGYMGGSTVTVPVKSFHGLGTPADLEAYLNRVR